MSAIGNFLWFILLGFWLGIAWLLVSILCFITILGIPIGFQTIKIAKISFLPFGRNIKTGFDQKPIRNILWLLFFGISIAGGYVLIGFILMATIIGIPFGIQFIKIAKMSLLPVGAEVIRLA